MEVILDQGDSPAWTGAREITFCSDCEELGFASASEYGPYILTYGEDELGNKFSIISQWAFSNKYCFETGEVYMGSAETQSLRNVNGRIYKFVDPNKYFRVHTSTL